MSRTPDKVSDDIRKKLRTTIPELSLEIGTPERKLVDAVSEAISEAYIDQYVTGSLLDINSKSGLELEQMVGIFGYGRLQGRQAVGAVTLTLNVPAVQMIEVPRSTEFYASSPGSGTPIYFISTQAVVFPVGATTIDVPVQCTVSGSVGNVPPNSINAVATSLGAASGTNLAACTGGVDVETDDQLRQRFRDTFLRNIAGTRDFYEALCLQSRYVSKVIVFGPTEVYRSQMVVPSPGVATNVTDAIYDMEYVWPESSSVFQNLGREDEVFWAEGKDYTFSSGGGIPTLTVTSGSELADRAGQIIDVEFEYITAASRNDPASGRTNCVDIYVDGIDPYVVSEANYTSGNRFSSSSSSPYYTGNFERMRYPGGSPGTRPSTSNFFMRLGSTPVVTFPEEIIIGEDVYVMGEDFWVVRDVTKRRGSQRAVFAVEWAPPSQSGPGGPVQSPRTPMVLTYTYNRLPEVLDALIAKSKQVTTNVLVHQAPRRYLEVALTLEYARGFDPALVNSEVNKSLKEFFARKRYGEWIYVADILMAARQVIGVVNVALTGESEAQAQTPPSNHYGIQTYAYSDGSGLLATYTGDFKLVDHELPVLLGAHLIRRPTQ